MNAEHVEVLRELLSRCQFERYKEGADAIEAAIAALSAEGGAALRRDAERLDYIERRFSGMTNRERYLPVQMIWGKGCNGRTLREACDKYMKRDAALQESRDHD